MSDRDHNDAREKENTLSPFGLIWDVMTSPLTLMFNSSMLGIMVALGTFIPQGSTEGELLAERTFAGTRSMMGLGFHQLSDSWLVWLFALLVGLNLVGIALRFLRAPLWASNPWQGPGVHRTSWSDPRSMDEVNPWLEARFSKVTRRADALIVRQGLWREGLIVLCASLICFAASLALDKRSGMEALLPVTGGGAVSPQDASSTLAVKVLEDGTWIERQLPFNARCNPSALTDPKRGWRCLLSQTQAQGSDPSEPLREAEIALGPRWPDEAFGMTFHIAKERPLPPTKELLQIVDLSSERDRLVYSGPSGRRSNLESGHSLSAFQGPNGPLVVVTPEDGRPYLLTPTRDRAQPPVSLEDGTQLAALSPWSLTMRASRRPGETLLWTGYGLVLLGLLLLVIRPHACLVVSPNAEGVLFSAWSLNRLDGAERMRTRCDRAGSDEGGA